MSQVSLGIPGVGDVAPGTHLCALYSGPNARDRLLLPFLREGLREGHKCLCLVDDVEPATVRRQVERPGHTARSQQADLLDVEHASSVYLQSGQFSVEHMTSFLTTTLTEATDENYSLLRAAGEMSWVLPMPVGAVRLPPSHTAVSKRRVSRGWKCPTPWPRSAPWPPAGVRSSSCP